MKLNEEEIEILQDFEEGRLFPSVTDDKILQKFTDGANQFIGKVQNINIRLTENDFNIIQLQAKKKGMSCQTLISNIIHQYISQEAV
ncbi:Uncharacterized protein dnl_12090 [Desulfonema limicola]|uniref:Uncharacterized protein n=1 Tax=Desulfonema limicola TaxID=45656 RepID=A0A975B540_9BACT|nr:hypothetical protein [Desulfonema limicola]QTA78962.1 Uncharacterized protein dnl_12090 [Desulfonema limicola]